MRIIFALVLLACVTACSHPLEIVGEGDIESSTGTHDCLLEDQPCDNNVVGDYSVTYSALPRAGWQFLGWEGCNVQAPDCSFNVPASIVDSLWFQTMPPLRAIFAPEGLLECNGKAYCTSSMVKLSVDQSEMRGSIGADNVASSWDFFDEITDLYIAGSNPYCSDESIPQTELMGLYSLERGKLLSHTLYSPEEFEVRNYAQEHITLGAGSPLGDRKPLILIHGWQGNDGDNNYLCSNSASNRATNYFQELRYFLQEHSNLSAQYKVYVYKYPSFEHITLNGRLLGELIALNSELKSYVDEGGMLSLLAHSMGGLVARSFIEEWGMGVSFTWGAEEESHFYSLAAGEDVVEKLITLATPHHGSPTAGTDWFNNLSAAALIPKNRTTPGSLDVMWDDFDHAIKFLAGSAIMSNNDCDESLSYELLHDEPRPVCFPSRERVRQFDIAHGGQEPVSAAPYNTDPSLKYFHPNPWLKNLNESLLESGSTTKYIVYGGSAQSNSDAGNNPIDSSSLLEIVKWEIASAFVLAGSNYPLNDAVVPTRSSLLDTVGVWDPDPPGAINNASAFLNGMDLTTDRYRQVDVQTISRRYLHDFDHDMMRGGTGRLGNGEAPPTYYDRYNNPAARTEALTQMGIAAPSYTEIDEEAELLTYEPLFNSLLAELGGGNSAHAISYNNIFNLGVTFSNSSISVSHFSEFATESSSGSLLNGVGDASNSDEGGGPVDAPLTAGGGSIYGGLAPTNNGMTAVGSTGSYSIGDAQISDTTVSQSVPGGEVVGSGSDTQAWSVAEGFLPEGGSANSSGGNSVSLTFVSLFDPTSVNIFFKASPFLKVNKGIFSPVGLAGANLALSVSVINQDDLVVFYWSPDGLPGGIFSGSEISDPFDLNVSLAADSAGEQLEFNPSEAGEPTGDINPSDFGTFSASTSVLEEGTYTIVVEATNSIVIE